MYPDTGLSQKYHWHAGSCIVRGSLEAGTQKFGFVAPKRYENIDIKEQANIVEYAGCLKLSNCMFEDGNDSIYECSLHRDSVPGCTMMFVQRTHAP